MRQLTVKRHKSFVGCLAKIKVYIEDAAADIYVNGVGYRKLGEIKNGSEATYTVGEWAAKVLVIADKVSAEYCNDIFVLPEGTEDVFLSGKCHLDPAAGNAFVFDGNDNTEAVNNRKKGKRKGIVVIIIAAIVGGLVGFFATSEILDSEPREKTFTNSGISITLTDEFEEEKPENFTAVFASSKVAVFTLREPFSLAAGFGELSLEEYGEMVLQGNTMDPSELKTVNGLTFFEYDHKNPQSGNEYSYYCFVYKCGDAFWIVNFATDVEDAESRYGDILKWAGSVSFDN